MTPAYQEFLARRAQEPTTGFEPKWMPDFLFPTCNDHHSRRT